MDYNSNTDPPPAPRPPSHWDAAEDFDNASPSRRRFLRFCQENPAADECRIYEL